MLMNLKDYLLVAALFILVLMLAFHNLTVAHLKLEIENCSIKYEQLSDEVQFQNNAIKVLKMNSDKQKIKLSDAESKMLSYKNKSEVTLSKIMNANVSKDCCQAIAWALQQANEFHQYP